MKLNFWQILGIILVIVGLVWWSLRPKRETNTGLPQSTNSTNSTITTAPSAP